MIDQGAAAIIASVIGATVTVSTLTLGNRKRNSAENHEIHVLVNSRLTAALDEINALRNALGITAEEPVPEPKDPS